MKRLIFPLAVSLCLLLVVSQHTSIAKDTWISVRTKNFFLVGNAGEKDIRQVGLKLEQFREVFTRLFPKITFNTPVPTTVIVFKSDNSYRAIQTQSKYRRILSVGTGRQLHHAHDRSPRPAGSVHRHLSRVHTPARQQHFRDVPLWFNEGLAEYYSTFRSPTIKRSCSEPIGSHVFLLRESKMLPLKTLFEVDHKSPHYNERKSRESSTRNRGR